MVSSASSSRSHSWERCSAEDSAMAGWMAQSLLIDMAPKTASGAKEFEKIPSIVIGELRSSDSCHRWRRLQPHEHCGMV